MSLSPSLPIPRLALIFVLPGDQVCPQGPSAEKPGLLELHEPPAGWGRKTTLGQQGNEPMSQHSWYGLVTLWWLPHTQGPASQQATFQSCFPDLFEKCSRLQCWKWGLV
ncbi:hypothetical protein DV515_00013661 [Chloebia gouldiae]|uniref:Uncharacterized protein n=1 Tax=Chloebia gouldiae TaxID=44316 RepID=A0A3L8S0N1_CHLGU|nr:hypothetical protein DV515_00013661 [Chloebia gouldiae]